MQMCNVYRQLLCFGTCTSYFNFHYLFLGTEYIQKIRMITDCRKEKRYRSYPSNLGFQAVPVEPASAILARVDT